jgi:hypothetical protein
MIKFGIKVADVQLVAVNIFKIQTKQKSSCIQETISCDYSGQW